MVRRSPPTRHGASHEASGRVPVRVLALLFVVACLWMARAAAGQPTRGIDASLYAEILETYTARVPDLAGTRVDYERLRDEPDWQTLLASLDRARPSAMEDGAERMAFWINVYNILAIDTVLRAYPVESIRDVGSLFFPVWRREAGRVGGRAVTLHQVEHEILRPMGDPRIHAALVCASTSCPSLRREPYSADALDAQLDEVMGRFLADPRKGLKIDRTRRRVTLSRIFDWFEEDFEPFGGALVYIAPWLPPADRAWLSAHRSDVDLDYFDYDWRLNSGDVVSKLR